MQSLFEIGKKHGTDKVIHAYLPHYANRFEKIRDRPVTILEIGVQEGKSLRMWKEYFEQGQIYGIDAVQESIFEEDRLRCFMGRQEDEGFLRGVVEQTGDFNIVIDDGGHRAIQHVASFEVLWDHVKPGGWYCIEDAITIFDICWTFPEHRTILDTIQERWKGIIRSDDNIAEVAVMGCDTQKKGGRNNGLIFLRKAVKEPQRTDENRSKSC